MCTVRATENPQGSGAADYPTIGQIPKSVPHFSYAQWLDNSCQP